MNSNNKILITCVNYKTYSQLEKYIYSIEKAYFFSDKNINKIDVLIGDNSSYFKDLKLRINEKIKIIHTNNRGNLGYIGGITKAVEKSNINITDYDYFIISNVDLTLSKSFFNHLLILNNEPDIGWLAPAIISEKENRDRNPKILKRPSLKKMQLTTFFYKFPILHYMYEKTIYKKKKKQIPISHTNNEIYAGHGSFMIFTKLFVIKNKNFHFPSFLFGEEIYFAELNRISKLKTIYIPEIVVYDYDHASTSKMKKSTYYKMNYESLKILTKLYFKNE